MKKLVISLTMVLAILTAVPLFAAFMVVVLASPAAGEVLKAQACQGSSMVVTGPWRVPTSQKYVITSGFGPRPSPGGIGSTDTKASTSRCSQRPDPSSPRPPAP